jgi:hypothetical protein
VRTIVANDTAINNKSNSSLSTGLQNSHETCLQDAMDDYNYQGLRESGAPNAGGSFKQVPGQSYVPRESSYPAYFSVLASFVSKGNPTSDNLLTYVKASAGGNWKLALTSQIFGPTSFGVHVPAPATLGGGFAMATTQPSQLAATVASAMSADASSGRLPPGVTAQWGPKQEASPRTLEQGYSQAGGTSVTFSLTPPPAARSISDSPACPLPAYKLADGSELALFPVYLTLRVTAESGLSLVQGAERQQFGVGLAPGNYRSVTSVSGDVIAAIVPPASSHAPIEVIGQGLEQLSASGSSGSSILA